MLSMIPILSTFPLIGILLKDSQTRLILLILNCFLLGIAECVSFQAAILLISDSSEPHRLGLVHGIASTASAAMRTLSPTLAGMLWEAGIAIKFSGFVFIFCSFVALVAVLAGLKMASRQDLRGYKRVLDME